MTTDEEFGAYLLSLPELVVPEEVSRGLWRLEVAPGLWRFTGHANGLTVEFMTTTKDYAASVRGYVLPDHRIGIEFLHADGSVVWSQEVVPPWW